MSETPVPEFIQNLTDDELRKELVKNGENVGPITPTTRNLYKKRLIRKLNAVSSLQCNEKPTECHQKVEDVSQISDKTTQTTEVAITELGDYVSLQQQVEPGRTPTKRSPRKQCCPKKLLLENREIPEIEVDVIADLSLDDPLLNSDITITQDVESLDSGKLYYGIFIPKSDSKHSFVDPIIFENKLTALSTLKKHKNARFREFQSLEKAKDYSLNGSKTSEVPNSPLAFESEGVAKEFPSLKQEDLNKLTRCIENGDLPKMLSLVWSNPKYLINSADGPVTLKPNTRYNALHIAAKSNQPEICREILSLLQNPDFQSLLFSNFDDVVISRYRTDHLINAYLNTPEKILFETPLHLASKSGFKEVVRELVMHESCSTTATNKSHQTALDIVCSRASSVLKQNKAEIQQLLTNHYYVPLLRYHDNSESAIVGEPITSKQEFEKFNERSSTLQSTLSMTALAGPMQKNEADAFRKIWITPSKQKVLGEKYRFIRRLDCEKGSEQIGRELASRGDIGWSEFWDFLNDFANFATEEGLQKLENFLKEKASENSNSRISLELDDLVDSLHSLHFSPNQENNWTESDKFRQSDSSNLSSGSCMNGSINKISSNGLCEISKTAEKLNCDETVPSKCDILSTTNFQSTDSHTSNGAVDEEAAITAAPTSPKTTSWNSTLTTTQNLDTPRKHFLFSAPVDRSSVPSSNFNHFNLDEKLNLTYSRYKCQKSTQLTEGNSSVTDESAVKTGSGDVMNANEKIELKTPAHSFSKLTQNDSTTNPRTPIKKQNSAENVSAQKPSNHMSVDNFYFVSGYRCASESESDILSSPSGSTISDAYPMAHSRGVFLTGLYPTKRDQDVVTAIGDAAINPDKFPAVFRWRTSVLSYPDNDRRKWATPRKSVGCRTNLDSDVKPLSDTLSFSPSPSSGRVKSVFSTPQRDLRRLLYRPMSSPHFNSNEVFTASFKRVIS